MWDSFNAPVDAHSISTSRGGLHLEFYARDRLAHKVGHQVGQVLGGLSGDPEGNHKVRW